MLDWSAQFCRTDSYIYVNMFLWCYQITFQNLDRTLPDVQPVKEGGIQGKTHGTGNSDSPASTKDEVSLSPPLLLCDVLIKIHLSTVIDD